MQSLDCDLKHSERHVIDFKRAFLILGPSHQSSVSLLGRLGVEVLALSAANSST